MEDTYSNSKKEESSTLHALSDPDRLTEDKKDKSSNYWGILAYVVLLGVGGIGLIWLLSQVLPFGGELTCHVGTAKYDSFDAWGGNLTIQEMGEPAVISQWKCGIKFSFSKGSVLMSRGCLSREEDDAAEANKKGLLWIAKNNHLDKVNLDCFMKKKDLTILSCTTTSRLPKAGGRIPWWLIENYRLNLCNSRTVKGSWFYRLLHPFASGSGYHGLSCSAAQATVIGFPGSPEWDAWWVTFEEEMRNLGFVGWSWRRGSNAKSIKSSIEASSSYEMEEERYINANGTLKWTHILRLLPDQEILRSTFAKGHAIKVRVVGPVNKWLWPGLYQIPLILNFQLPSIVAVESVQVTQKDRDVVIRFVINRP